MSEKSVAQKLGVKAGQVLFVKNAPVSTEQMLGQLPDEAKCSVTGKGPFKLILMFANDRQQLEKDLPACKAMLEPGGALWVAYAKGTSSLATDINRDSIHDYTPTIGLDTVSQIAIDKDWSAMRLKVID